MLARLKRLWAYHIAALEDRLTVRQQIVLSGAAVSFAVVGVLTVGATYISRQHSSDLISRNMSTLAQSMANQLENGLRESYRDLGHFASLEALVPVWTGPVGLLRELLEQLQEKQPEYDWLAFAAPDGKVRAAAGGQFEGLSIGGREWVAKVASGAATENVQTDDWLQIDEDTIDPSRLVHAAFSVRAPDGRLIGVLVGHLSWQWAQDLRRRILHNVSDRGVVDLLILAHDGIVLVGEALGQRPFSEATHAAMRRSPFGTFVDKAGNRPMLTGFAAVSAQGSYRNLNWTVIARQSEAVAFAQARELAWFIAGLGLLMATVGGVAVHLIAGRVARPIHNLAAEADRLGRDPSVTMLRRQRGSMEVVHLSGALRSLLRRIGFAQQRTYEAELRASENAAQFASDLRALRKLADTDPLTNLMNRRAFLAAGSDALEYFKRYDRSMAILVIDIDHFKLVNDSYGHAAGDAVIRRVGEVIEDAIRTTDRVSRFGGEEFVVLLREVDTVDTKDFAERVRVAVNDTGIGYGGDIIRVTVSIGAALAHASDRDIEDTIARADRGLYMAKNTGRDRVYAMVELGTDASRHAA